MSKIGVIMGREYRERVAKKSFIITTLLMPVLMALLMVGPAALLMLWSPDHQTIAVVDESSIVLPALQKADLEDIELKPIAQADASALADEQFDGILTVPSNVVDNPRVALYMHGAGSMDTERAIRKVVKDAVQDERLKAYNISNLQEILAETEPDVDVHTIRIDETGEEGETSASSEFSFFLGLIMSFLLYMLMMIYGGMVMTSIIEEKNNRVLDLIVTTAKPMQIMLGKILGVGAVAVTQIVIWGILICLMSAFLLPLFITPEISSDIAAMQGGGMLETASSGLDTSMLQGVALLSSVGFIAEMLLYMLLFLIGGFLLYSAMYAAMGSAVDNIQDASQFQSFIMLPIMVSMVFDMVIAENPNTTIGVVLSMVPLTSPLVMLVRIPFGIDGWQIWVSLAILFASAFAMTWIAAKIYRVGIFMHGAKPSIADLVRWARYK